ncbi:MAG: hypothetical protein ACJ747_13810 [Gaiellaceae bacterium]
MTEERPVPAEATRSEEVRAEETRLQRGVRYGHRTTLYFSLAVVIATVVFLVLLIVRNTRQVKVDYVFGSAHARVIWLIIISGLLGWACGLATSYLLRRRTRRPR